MAVYLRQSIKYVVKKYLVTYEQRSISIDFLITGIQFYLWKSYNSVYIQMVHVIWFGVNRA